MKKKKLRKFGKILLDIEPYLLEMADHDIQWGDYFGSLYLWLETHLKSAQEEYADDDSRPIFFYGHKKDLIELSEKLKKVKNGKI